VDVVGDYAFVADYDSGLLVISIADTAHPVEVGHVDTPGSAGGVDVNEGCAHVADYSGLRLISVADPTQPSEVGHLFMDPIATRATVSGGHTYVADMRGGLKVVSVADTAHPVEVGYYSSPHYVYDVAVAGDYAFAACFDGGLQIYQFYGAGIEESPKPQASNHKPAATVARGVLSITRSLLSPPSSLLSTDGRKVLALRPGANDVRGLAPGIYFILEAQAQAHAQAAGREPSAVTKVVLTE
jgi:hypothetical protein